MSNAVRSNNSMDSCVAPSAKTKRLPRSPLQKWLAKHNNSTTCRAKFSATEHRAKSSKRSYCEFHHQIRAVPPRTIQSNTNRDHSSTPKSAQRTGRAQTSLETPYHCPVFKIIPKNRYNQSSIEEYLNKPVRTTVQDGPLKVQFEYQTCTSHCNLRGF